MGSSGGGNAGKVDYPEYLKTIQGKWLDSSGTDTPSLSAVDLLNEAFITSPYDGLVSYTGRDALGSVSVTISQTLAETLALPIDPYQTFQSVLPQVGALVEDQFSVSSIQNKGSTLVLSLTNEHQQNYSKQVGKDISLGNSFSSTRILNQSYRVNEKLQAITSKTIEELETQVLQQTMSMFTDSIFLLSNDVDKIRICRGVFKSAVEFAKLTILNEREYFNQLTYYTKYKGHWKFEQAQEILNDIAKVNMKKVLFDQTRSDWMGALGIIAGYGSGDFLGASIVKNNKDVRDGLTKAIRWIGYFASSYNVISTYTSGGDWR